MRHFLKSTDFSREEAAEIFALARQLKSGRNISRNPRLAGQTWALLFHKSSTRTRISFEVGIHELGGHPMILDANSLQMGRGESIEDTARVMSRYIHGIIIRTYEHELLEQFAAAGTIPVVNALTDKLHPCQIYADGLTLAEKWAGDGIDLMSSLKGRTLTFVGDCASNMAHSWILGGALFGMNIRLTGPAEYAPEPWIDDLLAQADLPKTYKFTTDAHEAAKDSDVLYTDVWVSMGDEAERDQRLRDFQPFQINRELFAQAKPDALFLHCLPAHEGEEVTAEIYRSPRSIVFDQAENRLHMQKAILAFIAMPRS